MAVALLSGALMDDALKTSAKTSRPGALLASLTIGAALLSMGYLAIMQGQTVMFLQNLAICGSTLAAVAGLFHLAKHSHRQWQSMAFVGLVGFSAVEMTAATSGLRVNARPPLHYDQQERPENSPHFERITTLSSAADPSGVPWRVETLGLGPTVQNIGQAAGLQALLGYNPIRLRSLEEQIAPTHQNNAANRRYFGQAMTSYDSEMANRLGLRYIMTAAPISKIDPALSDTHFPLLGTFPVGRRLAHLYENPRAQARAQVLAPSGEPAEGRANVTRYGHAEITIDAECTTPCRLVLRDFHYPGWVATVNDAAQPVLKEEGIFRAVDLTAGHHEVVFRFKPLSRQNLSAALTRITGQDPVE